ncbi:hypothetical protein BJY00DRAFT_316944 [Aspergillus carlsbadensis]|nr:hypothetical protein BJY00DRAFT_316944 [Aspergillus carlsbadensis]
MAMENRLPQRRMELNRSYSQKEYNVEPRGHERRQVFSGKPEDPAIPPSNAFGRTVPRAEPEEKPASAGRWLLRGTIGSSRWNEYITLAERPG